MLPKIVKGILIIFILLLLTSCWNRRELNELSIASAIGIDALEDQKGYQVSVQILNPSEVVEGMGGGGYDTPVSLYTSTGETIHEAMRKMTKQVPNKVYLAHVRMVFLGEELAKQGIAKPLDFISRYRELRTDFYIAVTREVTAHQVLQLLTPIEKLPANKMFHSLETSSRKWAETDGVFLDELIHDILSEGKHPVITGIQIIGNPEEGKKEDNVKTSEAPVNFRYSGMGIFREDKLIGWLDEDESKAYNYIRNAVESTIINTNCSGDGYIGYDLIRASRKVKVIMKDSQPTIDLSFELEGDISDVECNQIDLADPQQIKQKEKEIATIVQEKIMRSIKNVQEEYQVDIFGFGDMIYRQKPQAWKKLKDDWDQHFVQLEVNVTVDAKIRRVGTIANTFKRK